MHLPALFSSEPERSGLGRYIQGPCEGSSKVRTVRRALERRYAFAIENSVTQAGR